jgi:hypothetical protein
MTLAFHGNADIFMRFFEEVEKRGLKTEEEKVKLLVEMAQSGEKISVWKTKRTPEQIVKSYAEHGNVLYLHPNGDKGEDHERDISGE